MRVRTQLYSCASPEISSIQTQPQPASVGSQEVHLLMRILTFVAGVLAVAVSCSFRALNQSCVTGASPAIFLLRLYL